MYHLLLQHTTKSSECLLITLQLFPVQSPACSGPQCERKAKQNRLTHSLDQVKSIEHQAIQVMNSYIISTKFVKERN